MARDLRIIGEKLQKYRLQFQVSISELSVATGIEENSLKDYEQGNREPTGDEILILSDYYKCDYKFFISNEKLAPFEQTETLFRIHGNDFSRDDRWAVQELLYLAECEAFLEQILSKARKKQFAFRKVGTFLKGQGRDAALSLRRFLDYPANKVPLDIYADFRSIGIHLFRRALENSGISGLCIHHPVAGKCVFINYSEDVYRQRFTGAHEAAHAILDAEEDVVVSFKGGRDSKEIRANAFASCYLMPPEFLSAIPDKLSWNVDKALEWAAKLKVSTEALAYALRDSNLISDEIVKKIKAVRVPTEMKTDPELPPDLPIRMKERKQLLLHKGLSSYYVNLCFEAYHKGFVSAQRIGEMLLLEDVSELRELAEIYREKLDYES
jgi:Zn-dependent peptidase ImmA (M78 family)/transcriptional regulator with XRE-family HTH domain